MISLEKSIALCAEGRFCELAMMVSDGDADPAADGFALTRIALACLADGVDGSEALVSACSDKIGGISEDLIEEAMDLAKDDSLAYESMDESTARRDRFVLSTSLFDPKKRRNNGGTGL